MKTVSSKTLRFIFARNKKRLPIILMSFSQRPSVLLIVKANLLDAKLCYDFSRFFFRSNMEEDPKNLTR